MIDDVKCFSKLIVDIAEKKPSTFNGLGLVLYKHFKGLPVQPLTIPQSEIKLPISNYHKVLEVLLKLSTANHLNHDGFHLFDKDCTLTHISQYLSSPIIKDAKVEFGFGSRYMTALYGSYLGDVLAIGIVSKNYGPAIFIKGVKFNLPMPQ